MNPLKSPWNCWCWHLDRFERRVLNSIMYATNTKKNWRDCFRGDVIARVKHIRSQYRILASGIPILEILHTFSATPFGKLPLLEVDGKVIPQSQAIARYVAKQFGEFIFNFSSLFCFIITGFAGNTPFESAWVDAIGDQFTVSSHFHQNWEKEIPLQIYRQ